MARVAFGGIWHETNTFSSIPTTLASFRERSLLRGARLLELCRKTDTALGGIVDACEARGWELVPTLFASATPGGYVEHATFGALTDELAGGIRRALPLDGIVLVLHGALAAERHLDGEAEILRRVRAAAGPDVPIAVVLDFHANLTGRMVEAASVLVGYDTYPHVDARQRGVEAVRLLARVLDGASRPAHALRQVPILAPLTALGTDGAMPMGEIMAIAQAAESTPGILNVLVAAGFAYGDVPGAGMSVLVTTDGDALLADQVADEVAVACWSRRERFRTRLASLDEAIHRLRQAPHGHGPIVLADVADNPGGGAPGDGTAVLEALLRAGVTGVAIGAIADPETVEAAWRVGAGGSGRFQLGGKLDRLRGPTLDVEARVRRVDDITFRNSGPIGAGTHTYLGRSAVLELGPDGGIEAIVSERRAQALDPELFRALGIEPERRRGLVVKSSVHFRAAFEPIACEIIEVDGPGLASPHLERFGYQRVRSPIWPLDPQMRWSPRK